MLDALLTPDAILADLWQRLQSGASDPAHPYHTPAIATTDELQGPMIRTVILRKFEPDQRVLSFHTDRRSAKFSILMKDRGIAWLFWDPALRLQVSIQSTSSLHTQDAVAHEQWVSSTPQTRSIYQTPLAPGAVLPGPLLHRPPPVGDGRDNFAVVRSQIHHVDWLYLHPVAHRRARFTWPDGQMLCQWLAP
jgi:hypothetical protein